MIPSFNQNINIYIIFKWLFAITVVPHAAFGRKGRGKAVFTRQSSAVGDIDKGNETTASIERRMFTGNFFAGPVALIHPALLKPAAKNKGRK